jgi:hypothetical protein
MRSLRDMQNALQTSISLRRVPVGEPGGGSFAGTFDRKEGVYLGSFLGHRGHYDSKSGGHLNILVKELGSPDLISDYGTHRGPSVSPRCIGNVRTRTQYQLINQSINSYICSCNTVYVIITKIIAVFRSRSGSVAFNLD